jgi:dTDP-4-amino-4,6-dideoxygalactose transaminase
MSNIVATIGRGQLKVIEERVAKRRKIFSYYQKAFSGIDGISFMPEPSYGRSNRWLTCMLIDNKKIKTAPEQIRLALEKENIESRPLWKPMHLQPVFIYCSAYGNVTSD